MTHPDQAPVRPVDVDTGFWLWVTALPLMVAGYLVDLWTGQPRPAGLLLVVSVVFIAIVVAVVVTFLILMRQGYRWTRTVLTGGAIASMVYSVMNLFTGERQDLAAMAYAATVIVGAVLIAGGVYLLHRKDAHEFFTR
ncbi:hypothetical protein JDV09_23470 [Mycobacterium sp. Y57]|uniref:hypothetical protein n=1 Tax=Mycolicibacterium xanthum TaxID=2796469 RepID=UPI001C8527C7|nr:hypothetical protein [Mycolicibacterium xanthum]MBX7435033.1 hypothetical protein [Mycolicibacterium xanthum]